MRFVARVYLGSQVEPDAMPLATYEMEAYGALDAERMAITAFTATRKAHDIPPNFKVVVEPF